MRHHYISIEINTWDNSFDGLSIPDYRLSYYYKKRYLCQMKSMEEPYYGWNSRKWSQWKSRIMVETVENEVNGRTVLWLKQSKMKSMEEPHYGWNSRKWRIWKSRIMVETVENEGYGRAVLWLKQSKMKSMEEPYYGWNSRKWRPWKSGIVVETVEPNIHPKECFTYDTSSWRSLKCLRGIQVTFIYMSKR